MMKEVVLVTQEEFVKAEEVFLAASAVEVRAVAREESALAEAVLEQSARAVIVGVDRYVGSLYEALGEVGGSRGAIIARYGVGHDGIDQALALKNNIVVTNTPGVLDQSVVEHAIWLLGSMARNIPASHAELCTGHYFPRVGREVYGKVLGILGVGSIGRRVAAAAHFGLGMRVQVIGRRTPAELEQQEGKPFAAIKRQYGIDAYSTNVEQVLSTSDVVSIHVPSTESTRHFINANRLAVMKPGAMLVNTSRGPIVDEAALYDALVAGRLAAAALDVFENEPYEPVMAEKDLRTLENVVLTPHIGSNTHECNQRMSMACLQNITNFFSGNLNALSRVD